MWYWFDKFNIWQPSTLRKNKTFSDFALFLKGMATYKIEIVYTGNFLIENTDKFECGPGPMIFDRDMPIDLEKIHTNKQNNVKLNTCMAFKIRDASRSICCITTDLVTLLSKTCFLRLFNALTTTTLPFFYEYRKFYNVIKAMCFSLGSNVPKNIIYNKQDFLIWVNFTIYFCSGNSVVRYFF